MSLGLVSEVTVELHDGVELTAHLLFWEVVVPAQGGGEIVLTGVSEQFKTKVMTIVRESGDAGFTLHGVDG